VKSLEHHLASAGVSLLQSHSDTLPFAVPFYTFLRRISRQWYYLLHHRTPCSSNKIKCIVIGRMLGVQLGLQGSHKDKSSGVVHLLYHLDYCFPQNHFLQAHTKQTFLPFLYLKLNFSIHRTPIQSTSHLVSVPPWCTPPNTSQHQPSAICLSVSLKKVAESFHAREPGENLTCTLSVRVASTHAHTPPRHHGGSVRNEDQT
jgi:hypothetical protein